MIAGLRVDGGVGSHGGLCARYVLYPSVRQVQVLCAPAHTIDG
jgi:hypothetical protein